MTRAVKIFIIGLASVFILTFWASYKGWGLERPKIAEKSIRHGSVHKGGVSHRTHAYYRGK